MFLVVKSGNNCLICTKIFIKMNVRKISILLIFSVLMMQSCDSNSLKRAMAKYYFSDFDLEAVGGNVSQKSYLMLSL